ncbi:hypothetical protein DFP72DRAFT_846284 [Ephemerocybe angulata]|uniref:Uncharacterized protein n=1 Tax=Ephemerocybe angulata TaxID=980116 RepID=A0A8H6I1H3_9AGAR|nr:hypothetical protein DFP72DRAFT_846284 [Tulosesus angulatus]
MSQYLSDLSIASPKRAKDTLKPDNKRQGRAKTPSAEQVFRTMPIMREVLFSEGRGKTLSTPSDDDIYRTIRKGGNIALEANSVTPQAQVQGDRSIDGGPPSPTKFATLPGVKQGQRRVRWWSRYAVTVTWSTLLALISGLITGALFGASTLWVFLAYVKSVLLWAFHFVVRFVFQKLVKLAIIGIQSLNKLAFRK